MQLERNRGLFTALDKAESDDFLHRVASSQYSQQQHWEALAQTQDYHFQNDLQGDFPPEVMEATPEASEVKPVKDTTVLTSTSQTSNQLVTPEVMEVVSESVSIGKSDTWIIENVLDMGGRKFQEGKQILEQIKQEITTNA